MRRIMMMTIGGGLIALSTTLVSNGAEVAPTQAPVQAPEKQAPVPVQAPTQKLAPVQAPTQAPTQKSVAQCQSPVQKGEAPMKTARVGLFNRYR
jgi:hypothetical protein